MTTDTLNKVQDEPNQRHPQGRAAVEPGRAYRHHQFDARPIVEAMGKMSFTSRDLARATGIYNQMLEDPNARSSWSSPARPRPAAAWTSMPSWCATTWSTRSSPPAPRSSTWISSKRLATSTTKPMKSLTMIRCARSTSTASTTPISTRAAAGLRLHHRQDRRQPRAAPLLEPRLHPRDGQVAERGQRQEGQQPGQARLRA
jgi:hypothetical protein